jgi:hypothetical protein
VIKDALPAVVRSRAASLAGLLAGLFFLPLPGTASDSASAGEDRERPWAVAQGEATPNPAVAQLQELIQQADALKAKRAYPEAALLWKQILSIAEPLYKRSLEISEKALGREHPDTASSLNNLALLQLEQSNTPAAEPLLQRLNLAQANWLLRELPLQPRDLRGGLIDQQPDAAAVTFALLDQRPAAATPITNPDFGPAGTAAKAPQAAPADLRDLGPWLQLPGTDAEAAGLTPLLRPRAAISGRQATAALVLQQQQPRILHIATHGFFLTEPPASTAPASPAGMDNGCSP